MSPDRSGAIAAAMITSAIAPTTMTPTMIHGRWRRSVVRIASTSLLHPATTYRPPSPRMRQELPLGVPMPNRAGDRTATSTFGSDGGQRRIGTTPPRISVGPDPMPPGRRLTPTCPTTPARSISIMRTSGCEMWTLEPWNEMGHNCDLNDG